MLQEQPELLNVAYEWNTNDKETAIQAAAQVGSAAVAEFLLAKGAPLEICTAAMLGRSTEVRDRLNENPQTANEVGAHGIPLLPHAVWSGNLDLVQLVFERGATLGKDLALQNAVVKDNSEIVEWLLENAKPNANAKNFQGKTPLTVAKERRHEKVAQLLIEHGATE
jgi:uncharacterized protein